LTLLVRGLVWFGLYVALTLLPLAVAWWERPWDAPRPFLVEASVATGFIALPLMIFQFALVSRLGPASRPFGSDALMQVHAQVSWVALGAVLLHPLLLLGHGVPLTTWNPFSGPWLLQTGAIALWGTVLIVVTSVFRRRLRLGYEAWQVLHLALAVVLTAAMVLHVLAARGYGSEPGMRTLLVAYAGLALLLLLRYRVIRPLMLWQRPWEVVDNLDVGGSTRLLRVKPVGHPGFDFEAGQFSWLITGSAPLWSPHHPISMASSAERRPDAPIEFAIKALGDWSGTVVPHLKAGARLWVDGAFGAFTPEGHAAQGYVLIAGGIGISPMRSILLTLADRDDVRPVVLFYAAHDWSRVSFRDELEGLSQTLNLKVVFVFEKPGDDWDGERGFITAETLKRHLPRQHRRFAYFVCGPVPMMDAMEHALLALDVPADAIHSERFDMV
jgi:predicted ferric reductase